MTSDHARSPHELGGEDTNARDRAANQVGEPAGQLGVGHSLVRPQVVDAVLHRGGEGRSGTKRLSPLTHHLCRGVVCKSRLV